MRVIIVFALITVTLGHLEFTKCRKGGALPYYLEIEQCPEAPCKIYEGDLLKATAKGIARKSIMHVSCTIFIRGNFSSRFEYVENCNYRVSLWIGLQFRYF